MKLTAVHLEPRNAPAVAQHLLDFTASIEGEMTAALTESAGDVDAGAIGSRLAALHLPQSPFTFAAPR